MPSQDREMLIGFMLLGAVTGAVIFAISEATKAAEKPPVAPESKETPAPTTEAAAA